MEPCLDLLIQYVNAPRPDRAAEYDYCLRRNLANPAIASVHSLHTPDTVVPEEFRAHPRFHAAPIERWMTYGDAFAYANRHLADRTVCIANLDIFLDDEGSDWQRAVEMASQPLVLCLSRLEFNADGTTFEDPGFAGVAFAVTQDAWIFRAPFEVADCDFEIGTLGCDNALAHRIKLSGRLPVNSPQEFKILHYDRCRGKTSSNQSVVHRQERAARGLATSSYPEKQGAYLVPDILRVRSIDSLLDDLQAPDLQRYEIACEIMSRRIRAWNDAQNPRPRARHPHLLFPAEGSSPVANDTFRAEAEFFQVVAAHRSESHAQLFQDLYVLWKLSGKRNGFFCEFGATDGVALSNTLLLEKLGWSGVLAEPYSVWHKALHENRTCRIDTRAVWSRSGETLDFDAVDAAPELATLSQFAASDCHAATRSGSRRIAVETVSLTDLLDSAGAPADFDYLSVDTEGSELEVLAALDWSRFRPRVITVEHNQTPSRESLRRLLEGLGYRRELTSLSSWDDWYYWAGDLRSGQ